MYSEVSALLEEAKEASWKAKIKSNDDEGRDTHYKIKCSRISAAVLLDPEGWYLDGYEKGQNLLAITYRGCWWFHVKMGELPETVSAILFDRNVTWLKREDGNAGEEETHTTGANSRDSWPIPDPHNYFRNGYRSLSGREKC
jgi:hypothetical protein